MSGGRAGRGPAGWLDGVRRRGRDRLSGAVTGDPAMGAARRPLAAGDGTYRIPAPPAGTAQDDPAALPVPPADRWELPDERDPGAYLRSGRQDAQRAAAVLAALGLSLPRPATVLDLGCGYGRVLRWLGPLAGEGGELWGADIDADRVEWARRNLGGLADVVACSSVPHLPFDDATFDLVHAASVLPHISEQSDAWMLELRRITRPGGALYVTVYDDRTAELVRAGPASPDLARALAEVEGAGERFGRELDVVALSRRPGSAQVFRSRRWIERVWGRWFELVAFEDEALHVQTAVVLRRRPGPP